MNPQIWGSIPLRNPNFVGRAELLDTLRQRLSEAGTTAVVPEALHGLGGVGKSQTVIEYIYRHSSEYEVVWWVPSEHPAQINASFVDLAQKMGLPATSAEIARPGVLEALRTGRPYPHWLLVFDNADSPGIVGHYLPAGTGHVIVTSRNPEWAHVARTVEVDLFSRKESIELLRLYGGEITDRDAGRLAEALGDLPLSIEQAAAWRGQTGMPADEYLSLLEQGLPDLLDNGQRGDDSPSGYELSVAAAWNVPLNQLRVAHPAALQLLQLCAFFGSSVIPRSAFASVQAAHVPEELASALADPIKLSRAIREINRFSLAKIDHRDNTIQLHRLAQPVVKSQLTEEEAGMMRHAAHVLLAHMDPGDPASASTWPRYADVLAHAVTSRAAECRSDIWVRRLVINLIRYLRNSGNYIGAAEYAAGAMAGWPSQMGEGNEDVLRIASLRSEALVLIGHYDDSSRIAEEAYRQAKDAFGEDSEVCLLVADKVALSMRFTGRVLDELELLEDIVARSERMVGADDPATLGYRSDLAGCLRLTGQFRRAREVDADTVNRKKMVLGAEHPDTLVTANSLAMDIRECGDYAEACRLQEETLARQRAVIGDEHPRTIGAMRNLAVARRKAGLYREARDLSEECVRLYRPRSGGRSVDTITAEMGLSADLKMLGELEKARDLAEDSHQRFADLLGQAHPFTLVAAINLAVTYRLLKRVAEAKELNTVTHHRLVESFGEDHPFSLVCATNLASDIAESGDAEAACAMDMDTLERSTRVLGAEHPSTLSVALNMSIDLETLGPSAEASALRAATVTKFRNVLGADHPATLAADQGIRANCDTDTMQL